MTEAVDASSKLADAMKKGMRQWASGVAVISAKTEDGEPHAMTASSLTSVSDKPPSLLVCVNKSARMASVLNEGSLFCANLLTTKQQAISNACANPKAVNDRFKDPAWDLSATPRLTSASASFECKVVNCVSQDTHNIVIAEIIDVTFGDDSAQPLCYWNGNYSELSV